MLCLEESRTCGQERAGIRAHADLAAAVATVPPDLIAVATVGISDEVAGGQVFHRDAVNPEDLDSVPAAAAWSEVLGGGIGTARAVPGSLSLP
jgi:hypothetical protein